MKLGEIIRREWQPSKIFKSEELELPSVNPLWEMCKMRRRFDTELIGFGGSIKNFNARVNSYFKYIADEKDHWKTPSEFENDGGGDCEDFAIYKFYNLLGMNVNARLLGLRSKQTGEGHMVCFSPRGNGYILDNATDTTQPQELWSKAYELVYSLETRKVYTHRMR